MNSLAFIVNSQKTKPKIIDELRHMFPNSEIHLTSYAHHAEILAQQLAKEQTEIIVAVGGDGTIHEVVNGIMSSHHKPILAILPTGSANDFARGINLSSDLHKLKTSIERKKNVPIDLILIKNLTKQRYCINICDIGLGGHVVAKLHNNKSRIPSFFKYLLATINGFLTYKKSEISVMVDGETYRNKMLTAIFANGKCFGHGIYVAPEASISDGLMNIMLVNDINLFAYLFHLPKLLRKKSIKHAKIEMLTGKKIVIHAPHSIMMEADGEIFDTGNMELSILSCAISMIAT